MTPPNPMPNRDQAGRLCSEFIVVRLHALVPAVASVQVMKPGSDPAPSAIAAADSVVSGTGRKLTPAPRPRHA